MKTSLLLWLQQLSPEVGRLLVPAAVLLRQAAARSNSSSSSNGSKAGRLVLPAGVRDQVRGLETTPFGEVWGVQQLAAVALQPPLLLLRLPLHPKTSLLTFLAPAAAQQRCSPRSPLY